MAKENKTKATEVPVEEFLESVSEKRQKESNSIINIIANLL